MNIVRTFLVEVEHGRGVTNTDNHYKIIQKYYGTFDSYSNLRTEKQIFLNPLNHTTRA